MALTKTPVGRMIVVMRRLAGLFAFVLMLVSVAPVQCFGWQSTAAARMECCEKQQHKCPDQSAADACCGSSEQSSEQSAPTSGFLLSIPPVQAVAADLPLFSAASTESAARAFSLALDARLKRPPSFLTSVLLI